MEALPREIVRVLRVFEDVFSERVWDWVQVLVVGAILTPGQRTVAAVLRVLGLLVATFVPIDGPVVVGLDETIERRRGAKIADKGIYRDPVRSSKSYFVKTSGLRWICLMLLAPIPWAQRIWALPFLTVLAPSERYHQEREMAHKTLTDHARQMIAQVRRWLPDRPIVVVADSSYAVLDLLS